MKKTQNEKKYKIIQLAPTSHSYFIGDKKLDEIDIVKIGWFAQVARQIKKSYPEIEVECWAPEKLLKTKKEFSDKKIRFKLFPVTFSLIYALDFSIEMLKELKKEIKKAKQENYKLIIHLHEYHNLHGLIIASLFKKQKIIAQHHGGSWPLRHVKQTKRYKLFFPLFILGQIWENLVIGNINYFYALSQEEINYLKQTAPNSKIRLQTMGIDDFYFDFIKKNTARKKLGLPLNKKIILYIGRINEIKGVRYLINAMEELKDVELKIIGFSQDIEFFKNYAKKLNLKNTEFTGGVFGKKKLLYLSAGDALVLPSSKEGASVVVMEAMARNLPCVVSNVGGSPLMIEDGKNGILIKPRDTKEIVKAVKEILKWKPKNIKKYANRYRWKKIIDDTVDDYITLTRY